MPYHYVLPSVLGSLTSPPSSDQNSLFVDSFPGPIVILSRQKQKKWFHAICRPSASLLNYILNRWYVSQNKLQKYFVGSKLWFFMCVYIQLLINNTHLKIRMVHIKFCSSGFTERIKPGHLGLNWTTIAKCMQKHPSSDMTLAHSPFF